MWKLVKVIVSGISIGIAFLMLGYIGIYYTSGETIFIQEINLLGEIQTLQNQLFITGISGMLIALSIYYIEKTMARGNTETYRVILGLVFLTVSSIIAMMLNQKMNQNISDMMIMISATLVCIYAFVNGIRTVIYDMQLKKNYEKQQELKEPEKGN